MTGKPTHELKKIECDAKLRELHWSDDFAANWPEFAKVYIRHVPKGLAMLALRATKAEEMICLLIIWRLLVVIFRFVDDFLASYLQY